MIIFFLFQGSMASWLQSPMKEVQLLPQNDVTPFKTNSFSNDESPKLSTSKDPKSLGNENGKLCSSPVK